MPERERPVSCLVWPFWAIWRLVVGIVEVTGRLAAMILGIVLMIVGVVLTATIVGAVVGIPLFLFGLLLAVRGLW